METHPWLQVKGSDCELPNVEDDDDWHMSLRIAQPSFGLPGNLHGQGSKERRSGSSHFLTRWIAGVAVNARQNVVHQRHFGLEYDAKLDHRINALEGQVRLLERRVEELEQELTSYRARLDGATIWRLAELRATVKADVAASEQARMCGLVERLHHIGVTEGLFNMPQPQFDASAEPVEWTWINLKRKSSVSFWFDGDKLTVSRQEGTCVDDTTDPHDAQIGELMRWIIGN